MRRRRAGVVSELQTAIEVLDTTPSTMDAARTAVLERHVTFDSEGAPSCWGIVANEQTSGRGQRGRTWYSRRGESLCSTFFIRHGFALPEEAGQVSLMAGVIVAELLRSERSLQNVGLKWPNDVLVGGKKVGGILIEMLQAPDGLWIALVGVGINVLTVDFPVELRRYATSLAMESSDPASLPTPLKLALALGAALNTGAGIKTPQSISHWIRRWRELDATSGRRYETEWDGALIMGAAVGIDDEGALQLRIENGAVIAVTSASSLRVIER